MATATICLSTSASAWHAFKLHRDISWENNPDQNEFVPANVINLQEDILRDRFHLLRGSWPKKSYKAAYLADYDD